MDTEERNTGEMEEIQFYLAPMEGITRYVYRNAYHRFFKPMDKYFSPFLSPTSGHKFKHREIDDVLPGNNGIGGGEEFRLVPQILTNRAEDFLWAAGELAGMGYGEVNLNLGCPSRTVVSKGKGSGFLADPEGLARFLDAVFSGWGGKISVKTRLGMRDPEEWGRLLQVYNQFPLAELIVHPRLQADGYKGKPDWQAFGQALAESKNPLCYNGDIFTAADYRRFRESFPQVARVMLGRGILVNPGLLGTLETGAFPGKEVLRQFLKEIQADYMAIFSGEKNILFKMKELWCYLGELFPEGGKYVKKIKKAERLIAYEAAVDAIFRECEVGSAH